MRKNKPILRVRDVMKTDVDIVDGMTTIMDALNNMKHPETRTLIVDKRHEDDEYGVVMFRDVARRVLARDRSPDRMNIYEIMSKPVIGVDLEMDIRYCARLFHRLGFSYAPVTYSGELRGMIGYAEMLLDGLLDS